MTQGQTSALRGPDLHAMETGTKAASVAPQSRRSSLWAFRGTLSRPAQVGIGVAASVGLLLAWEAVSRLGLVNSLFLPAPSTVLNAMLVMVRSRTCCGMPASRPCGSGPPSRWRP